MIEGEILRVGSGVGAPGAGGERLGQMGHLRHLGHLTHFGHLESSATECSHGETNVMEGLEQSKD